ncbi:hypothetical protein HMPREF0972_01182 [Actinomyces sp. oral taxon 848 str. F0332]|nr:hypothetical protein HMPREF0972_01182 [Actinomyces sp. oral taxon 848 str. F0332]
MRLTLLYFSDAISQSPRPAARPRLPLSTGLAAEWSVANSPDFRLSGAPSVPAAEESAV